MVILKRIVFLFIANVCECIHARELSLLWHRRYARESASIAAIGLCSVVQVSRSPPLASLAAIFSPFLAAVDNRIAVDDEVRTGSQKICETLSRNHSHPSRQ